MGDRWNIVYYTEKDGRCLVEEFIESRNMGNQAKIMASIAMLEERGPILPRPYADLLTDGIHELRIKLSGDQIRILYFFCYKNYIILTHSFSKTTSKVPKKEINRAIKYRKDFLSRFRKEDLSD